MTYAAGLSELFISRHGRSYALIHASTGKLLKEIPPDNVDVTFLRRSNYILCGKHIIMGHPGGLASMEVSGHHLVTSGYVPTPSGTLMIEPLIKLWDLRMTRLVDTFAHPAGPSFIKFQPKYDGRIVVVSQLGELSTLDTARGGMVIDESQVTQADDVVTAMDVSSTGDYIAIASSFGVCQLIPTQAHPKVNYRSEKLEVPYLGPPLIPKSIDPDDFETSFSCIGMPHYTEPLSSVLPPHVAFDLDTRSVRPLDPAIMETLKPMGQMVSYAPNTTGLKRNCDLLGRGRRLGESEDTPRFRSEKEKRSASRDRRSLAEDEAERHKKMPHDPGGMPRKYRRVEIKYSRFGIEDFDFGFYNETIHSGLETHIPQSYTNSLLQALFHIQPLRAYSKHHIATACERQPCLLCELGFLFRMLEDGKGANCQASNFLRTFESLPQAAVLGLFEPDDVSSTVPYSLLIQNFNRFLMEQLHKNSLDDIINHSATPVSPIQHMTGIKIDNITTCLTCNGRTRRSTIVHTLDLQYPYVPVTASPTKSKIPFERILHDSIIRETNNKAWCGAGCESYQPLISRKYLQELPMILNINALVSDTRSRTTWNDDLPLDFEHTDPNQVQPSHRFWLPLHVQITLKGADIEIERKDNINDVTVTEYPSDIYTLRALVCQIKSDTEPAHLVAFIRVLNPSNSSDSQWFLFNDFAVTAVSVDEVLQFQSAWKVPSIILYNRKNVAEIPFGDVLAPVVARDILTQNRALMQGKQHQPNSSVIQLSEAELNAKSLICGIDAEFVAMREEEAEFRSDGTRSLVRPKKFALARVSVVRGSTPMEGIPFIDDYIAITEPIHDYLTEFSGIHPGDLDPAISKHHLVPMKAAYKKLRALLDLGCIFVGHGLTKDFRTINITVPANQVIDTVNLWNLPTQRKLSLRFLSWYLLGEDIQAESHSSIQDAQMAVRLYKKHQEVVASNQLQSVMEKLYEDGRNMNWRPQHWQTSPSKTTELTLQPSVLISSPSLRQANRMSLSESSNFQRLAYPDTDADIITVNAPIHPISRSRPMQSVPYFEPISMTEAAPIAPSSMKPNEIQYGDPFNPHIPPPHHENFFIPAVSERRMNPPIPIAHIVPPSNIARAEPPRRPVSSHAHFEIPHELRKREGRHIPHGIDSDFVGRNRGSLSTTPFSAPARSGNQFFLNPSSPRKSGPRGPNSARSMGYRSSPVSPTGHGNHDSDFIIPLKRHSKSGPFS